MSPIAGTQITALFGADGKVTGSDGCNTYNAPYSATANSLTVGLPVRTGMACPEDVAQQAQALHGGAAAIAELRGVGQPVDDLRQWDQKLLQYVAQ